METARPGHGLFDHTHHVNRGSNRPSSNECSSNPSRPPSLAELIDQRRRELFLESHHLGDLIRFDMPFNPAVGAPYHFGGTYSNQRCLPLPAAERLNNPLIGS